MCPPHCIINWMASILGCWEGTSWSLAFPKHWEFCHSWWDPQTTHELLLKFDSGGLTMPKRPTIWSEGGDFKPGNISLTLREGRRGWRLNSTTWLMISISSAFIMKPYKDSGHRHFGELPDWWTHGYVRRVVCPDSREEGTWNHFWTLPDLALCVFTWLILICITYNKTVIICGVLSWVLCHFRKFLNLRGV